jgi:1-acyl-sn-glycerol-3-phosphate acyltransferase
MRAFFVFSLLWALRLLSRLLYRYRLDWVGEQDPDWYKGIRVLAVLNHTSLYEPLLVGFANSSLLWSLANHGVLPIAEKTMKRPIGRFFNHLVRHVVVITRQRDHTWDEVLNHVDQKAQVIILPEGRMRRRNGLDSTGRPMTVRGGIVDILTVLEEGRMLVVYSGGLHHIQAPGERFPRLFRTIHARMELLEIADYCQQLKQGHDDLKRAVIKDLEQRRDRYCPDPVFQKTRTTDEIDETDADEPDGPSDRRLTTVEGSQQTG